MGWPPYSTAVPAVDDGAVEATADAQRAPRPPASPSFAQPAYTWSVVESYSWQSQAADSPRAAAVCSAYVRAATAIALSASTGHDDGTSATPSRYSSCSRSSADTSRAPPTAL